MHRTSIIPLALLLPLAACTSWPDAGYAPAAPVAPITAAPLVWPSEPFIVTAPGPSGAMTPYHVTPTPGGSVVQPGVLQPLRRYNTNGSSYPVNP